MGSSNVIFFFYICSIDFCILSIWCIASFLWAASPILLSAFLIMFRASLVLLCIFKVLILYTEPFYLYVRRLFFAYEISFFSEWIVFVLFLLFVFLCQESLLSCGRNLSFCCKRILWLLCLFQRGELLLDSYKGWNLYIFIKVGASVEVFIYKLYNKVCIDFFRVKLLNQIASGLHCSSRCQ